MEIYSGDTERLPSLGIQIDDQGWSLPKVLEEGRFDLAILTQNFNRGISVPEHYLDALRRHSPQTRVAILSEDLHGISAAARAKVSGQFRHLELAEDWSQREGEAFRRADLVIVPQDRHAEILRGQQILAAVVRYTNATTSIPSTQIDRDQLSQTLSIAQGLTPKPLPKESFSMTLVDALYAPLLEQTSGDQRVYARLDSYIQLSEQLLRHGRVTAARQQLRHIFGWLGEAVKLAPALAQPLGLLKRCYRQLGDDAMAARCAEEARRCFTSRPAAALTSAPAIKRKRTSP